MIHSVIVLEIMRGNPHDLRFSSSSNDNLIEDYVYSISTSPYPSYGGITVLGIAIHGWHGHNIKLTDYRETATGFSGTLEFHFYDHFGLVIMMRLLKNNEGN